LTTSYNAVSNIVLKTDLISLRSIKAPVYRNRVPGLTHANIFLGTSSFVGRTFSARCLVCMRILSWTVSLYSSYSLLRVLEFAACGAWCFGLYYWVVCSDAYPCYLASMFGSVLFPLCLRFSLTPCKMVLLVALSSVLHGLILPGHFNGLLVYAGIVITLFQLALHFLSSMCPSPLVIV
jgi:hypothetical protein